MGSREQSEQIEFGVASFGVTIFFCVCVLQERGMNEFAADIIWLLHILFVAWFVLTPFSSNENMLVLHAMMAPFLWLHWYTMRDECSLTMLEMKLRGLTECKQSFFWNVVSPIYKIKDADIRSASWGISIILWMITMSKILERPQMVSNAFMPFRSVHYKLQHAQA